LNPKISQVIHQPTPVVPAFAGFHQADFGIEDPEAKKFLSAIDPVTPPTVLTDIVVTPVMRKKLPRFCVGFNQTPLNQIGQQESLSPSIHAVL
jgi:hypothetical protein